MKERRHTTPSAISHDRWLVSYADFITLLFAFFVVLFASSKKDREGIANASQAIKGGFQQMGAFSSPRDSMPAQTGKTADVVARLSAPAPVNLPVDLDALRKQLQLALGKEIERQEVVMKVTPEGFVVSLRELGFFNSGEATLLPGASDKIERIAAVLMQHGLDLRVEGHSDNVPIHTAEFHSNWELSTARAMAVLTLLVDRSGFDPQRISVAGYGQYRPVGSNDSEEGRRMNRRVDLVVIGVTTAPQVAVH